MLEGANTWNLKDVKKDDFVRIVKIKTKNHMNTQNIVETHICGQLDDKRLVTLMSLKTGKIFATLVFSKVLFI